MVLEMLPSLTDGAKFKTACFALGEPEPPSFLKRLTHTGRGMDALLDFMKRIHFPGVSGFLCRKGFEAALAVLVNIIDYPSLAFFVRTEFAFANACHCSPLYRAFRRDLL
jgi:hypothetical protein